MAHDDAPTFLVFNAYLVPNEKRPSGYQLYDRKTGLPITVEVRPGRTLSDELKKSIRQAVTLSTQYANDDYYRRDGEGYLVIQGNGWFEKKQIIFVDDDRLVISRTTIANRNVQNEDQE